MKYLKQIFKNIKTIMGLDMYLYKKTYIKNKMKEKEIAYWRKNYKIHTWFVENIQNGNDDCNTYRVYISQLKKLLTIITENPDDFEDMPYTKELLKQIIKEGGIYSYESSW
jgi:hypothetical protein